MRAALVVQQLYKSCRTCFKFYGMFYFTCDCSFRPNNVSHGRTDGRMHRARTDTQDKNIMLSATLRWAAAMKWKVKKECKNATRCEG